MDKRAEELTAEIQSVFDKLRKLDVKPEYINFKRLSADDLEQELDAVTRQLKTRK